ncbi:hypothetical protein IWX50DRAFT_642621, partial [Phyllosticta citricarpa]
MDGLLVGWLVGWLGRWCGVVWCGGRKGGRETRIEAAGFVFAKEKRFFFFFNFLNFFFFTGDCALLTGGLIDF